MYERSDTISDNAEFSRLIREINALPDEKKFVPEYLKLINRWNEVFENRKDFALEYARKNKSVFAYSLIIENLMQAVSNKEEPKQEWCDQYVRYAAIFPNHCYTELGDIMIKTLFSIRPGGTYIDFSLPDSDGKTHTLSEIIEGNIAILNLWASWCGPCRRKGKELIPVYEEYKDKGLTVVGVARETNEKNMVKAIENDGYTWINLLELNDNADIWAKYGIPFSGGGIFLIDRDGKILAVDPDKEEILKILQEKL